jgi:arylsulfatase A-like enzyme
VGRIRAALRETGLEESTTLMFFSDHGDLHGSHGQFLKTSPLEESIRVPFIIGGGVPYYGGRKTGANPALVNHVDVAPTSLGLCDLTAPDWMRGRDFSGYFRADRPNPERPDSAFLQSVIPTGHGDSVDRPWRGLVTDDGWKFVCLEGQPWLLFNLNDDPFEQQNLAFNAIYSEKRKSLLERLDRWIRETGDSFKLPEL